LDSLLHAPAAAGESESPAQRSQAVTEWRPDPAEREAMWDRAYLAPWDHDFFALARRIEALHKESPGFGNSNRAGEDPVRFAQQPSLAFPPCTVAQFEFSRSNAPARVFVNFMGLLGPMGPMPLHLTEYAYQRVLHNKDRTIARFMDVFNHRMVSLYYRAWATSHMPASYDRGGPVVDATVLDENQRQEVLARDHDRYAVYIGSIFGLGMEEMRYRDAVPDAAKLHFAARLAGHGRGPEGLRAILATFFDVSVQVEEFAGRWLELPDDYHCRLGVGGPGGPASLGTLTGGGAVAGRKVWDPQGAFRIRLGPMSLKAYERILPGTPAAKRLDAWIRNYLGDEMWWEVVLTLDAGQVPRTQMWTAEQRQRLTEIEKRERLVGRRDEAARASLPPAPRLGWTTWIHTADSPEHRGDLVLRSPR